MTDDPVDAQGRYDAAATAKLLEVGREAGLTAIGVAPAEIQQPARTVLAGRKAAGMSGAMQFTYRNPERSTDPTRQLPTARSLIVGALAYSHDGSTDVAQATSQDARLVARVAHYARNNSYEELARALSLVADELTLAGHTAVVVADSNHLVDRNAAWRAGLGWYGKNSNLLVPGVGSWVVLGSVITDAELVGSGPPMIDGCGRCQACITGCPTEAIVAPGVVDATRCIAWMVQAAEPIPRDLRFAVGDRLYGCDDCQDVCPIGAPDSETNVGEAFGEVTVDGAGLVSVLDVLESTDADLLDRFGHWYIANRDPDVIRRTALVVLANVATSADAAVVGPVVARYLRSSNSLLVQHALWAADRLNMVHLVPDHVWDSSDDGVRSELAYLRRAAELPGKREEP